MLGIMSESRSRWDADALTHIARLSSPSAALKNALNTLIKGLKTDGVWDNIYAICVQHNVQGESLYDLKGTQDSTNLAGATWSSAGWSLGSTTGVMDTQVTPTSSSGMTVPDDNHLMTYLATSISGDGQLMGGGASVASQVSMGYGAYNIALGDIGYCGDSIFNSSADAAHMTIATPSGCIIGSLLSTLSAIRVGGTEATVTDSTIQNTDNGANSLHVGQANGAFADILTPVETFAAWSSGSGLSTSQRAGYYTRIEDYMVTMGWEA